MEYHLADGIYPSWSIFIKTIHAPQENQRKHFAKTQESARKDVERAFGVLQTRFAIVWGLELSFDHEMLKNIMITCIILHNMIVEDERHLYLGADDFVYDQMDESLYEPVPHTTNQQLMDFIERHPRIKDRGTHSELQADLIEHLFWYEAKKTCGTLFETETRNWGIHLGIFKGFFFFFGPLVIIW
jgi:hypothetical protein